ncbi:MAG TPA: Holliday junction branch migration protein RuvA [Bacilli bacterium]|nr:Holliday junction branch migration protein RuvA [Bacilli bacterium]
MKKLINYLKGTVKVVRGEYIVLECRGVGYAIKTGNPFAFALNTEATVYTHMYVRDDAIELYGFKTPEERDLFLKLISVRGIGPKGAMAIIASDSVEKVIEAINNSDASYLRRFPGVGLKTSQQIIIDLHGKLDFAGAGADVDDPKIKDVKAALKAMGYSQSEIKRVIPVLTQNINLPVEELLKTALKNII